MVVRWVAAPSPPLLAFLPDSVAPPLLPQVVGDVAAAAAATAAAAARRPSRTHAATPPK